MINFTMPNIWLKQNAKQEPPPPPVMFYILAEDSQIIGSEIDQNLIQEIAP